MPPSAAKLPPNAKLHLLLAVLFLAISPFIINCYFAHPQTDDFAFSVISREMGFLKAQYHWYTTWTGRFTSSALLSLNPLVFNSIPGYKLALALLSLAQIASIYVLVTAVSKRTLSWQQRLVFSLALTLAFVDQMDDIRSGLYWMAGVVTYQLAESLLILYLASLLHLAGGGRNLPLKSLTVVISVLLCGTNEVVAVVTFLVTALVLYHTHAATKRLDRFQMITLAAVTGGNFLAILAPGNFVRYSQYTQHKPVIATALHAFLFAVPLLETWATAPLVLILMYLIFVAVTGNPQLRKRFQRFTVTGSAAALLFLTFTAFFIPYYSTGAPPQNRVVNMIYLFFLVGWLLNAAVFSAHFGDRLLAAARRVPFKASAPVAAAFVVVLLALQTSNLSLVANDVLSGTSARYDAELQRRESQVMRSPEASVTVDPITTTPGSLYFCFVGLDGKNWINKYYAAYFGKKSVVRRPAWGGAPSADFGRGGGRS